MKKKQVTLKINMVLWNRLKKQVSIAFGEKYAKKNTDLLLIALLLYLCKAKNAQREADNVYLLEDITSDDSAEENYKIIKIKIYTDLMKKLKETCDKCTNSEAVKIAIANALYFFQANFDKDSLKPVYTFVGYKNTTMQNAVADAVDKMNLIHNNTTFIDGCCGTGSLFFGLHTYNWKHVILNDMNPMRTNFLNVLKEKGLEFVKYILEDNRWQLENDERLANKKDFKKELDEYSEKRKNYHKVDCNIEIAMKTLLYHCWDGRYPENTDDIFQRILRILPACLKLQNAEITQEDCLIYLDNNDKNKLVVLDVPYIGTEKQCNIKGYDYDKFHKKVADKLQQANYSFLYFCRSSAPKSDKSRPKEELERIMKMKIGIYFYNKGYFFQKVHLDNKKVTELIISNQQYDSDCQFEWDEFDTDIIN